MIAHELVALGGVRQIRHAPLPSAVGTSGWRERLLGHFLIFTGTIVLGRELIGRALKVISYKRRVYVI